MRRRLQVDPSSSPSKIIVGDDNDVDDDDEDKEELPIYSDVVVVDASCKQKAWIFGVMNGRRLIRKVRHRKSKSVVLVILLLGIVLFLFRISGIGELVRAQVSHFWLRYYESSLPFRSDRERLEYVQTHVIDGNLQYIPLENPLEDTYNVFDCPLVPPDNYPREYPILEVLQNWPVDDTSDLESRTVHQGICVFDFAAVLEDETAVTTLKQQIHTYSQAEVPYVVRNDPSVLKTTVRWNYGDKNNNYLFQLLGKKMYRGEVSTSNHLMYWNIRKGYTKVPSDFKRPTQMHPFTYPQWHRIATGPNRKPEDQHAYIRMDACIRGKACDSSYRRTGLSGNYKNTKIENADFWYEELPFFNADNPETSELYIVNKEKQRGIQCRFGMEGLTAENHFDGDRNVIAVLGGERRYLLAHPRNCVNMYLYEQRHPMERHSAVDWSDPNTTKYPNFHQINVGEVVLRAADVLYLPTQWFHHIVSLNLNYQCNTRSGYTPHYEHHIRRCGFHYTPP